MPETDPPPLAAEAELSSVMHAQGFAAGIEAAAKVAEAETGIYPHGNQMFGSAVPGKIAAAIRALAKETTDD